MSDNTQLAPRQGDTQMARVKNYMLSPEVKERFSEMMGANGIYYLNQVLILVGNNDELQKCEPKSILISAMRAASLKLSVDPSSGQAWIIPYKGKATFQLGYKGVYELAMRTNLYRFINVIDIFEGESITENRMTGMHAIGGQRVSDTRTAYMLYFQLLNGFEKTFTMSIEEIEQHARRYSQAYNSPRSKWNDPVERVKMERKTVMVNGLRKWGRFNSDDARALDQIESEQEYVDAELPDETQVGLRIEKPRSAAENMAALGFGNPEPVNGQYTREDAARDAAATDAEVTPPEPRQEPEKINRAAAANKYFQYCENATVLGITFDKYLTRWTDEELISRGKKLAAEITARENAIPG